MKSDVYFQIDNRVTVEISNGEELIFSITGPKEAVQAALESTLKKVAVLLPFFGPDTNPSLAEITEKAGAFKAALAKILYSPISWD